MHLSVIIPAYNEAQRIGKTLQSVGDYLKRQHYDWEILVVDNNSKDDTGKVAEYFQKSTPNLRILKEPRQGKGYAVQKGMLEASGDYRLFTDADNSTTIDHIEKLFPFPKQGFEVVIASIAVPGAKVLKEGREPLWRVVLGKLGNLWIQFWAVPGIWDTQRGFKLFTAKAAKDIFPRMTIFKWGFDVEVLAIARTHGYRIREVPITWSNPPGSKVNIWSYPQVLMETLKVSKNRILGTYKRKI